MRLEARADRLQESSDAKWKEGCRIAASYMSEPVKVDHYSANRHMRDLERSRRMCGQAVAEEEEANRCRGLADAAATFEEGRKHVGPTQHRLEDLCARRRRVERQMGAVVRAAAQQADTEEPIDPEAIVESLVRLDAVPPRPVRCSTCTARSFCKAFQRRCLPARGAMLVMCAAEREDAGDCVRSSVLRANLVCRVMTPLLPRVDLWLWSCRVVRILTVAR